MISNPEAYNPALEARGLDGMNISLEPGGGVPEQKPTALGVKLFK